MIFVAKELTGDEQQRSRAVRESYAQFWKSLAFTKQWNLYPFRRDEVEDLLRHAADTVVRIRSHLDARDPNSQPPVRLIDGCAREFLFSYDEREHPQANPRKFVRDLVHATLHDSHDYVEGLSADEIDEFVSVSLDCIEKQLQADADSARDGHALVEKIDGVWRRNAGILASVWPEADNERERLFTAKNIDNLRTLLQSLYSTELALKKIGLENARIQNDDTVLDDALDALCTEEKQKEEVEKEEQEEAEKEEKEAATSSSQGGLRGSRGDEEPFVPPPLTRGKSAYFAIEKVKSRVDKVADEVSDFKANVLSLTRDHFLQSGAEQGAKQVEKLQHMCRSYTEDLMQGLMSLDEIVGGADIRPERKRQVLQIQSLLDDVDSLNVKLKVVRTELREQAEEEQKKKQEEEQKAKKDEPVRAVDDSSSDDEQPASSTSLESMWRKMKLEPEWKTREQRTHYLVSSFLPGLLEDESTLELNEHGTSCTITGVRLPSEQEERLMRKQLRRRFRFPAERENELVLRAGAGRFGTFRSTFRLPSDAIAEKISARYERGVLVVTIPRRNVSPPPQRRAYPGNRRRHAEPFLRSTPFFNDQDFFW